jgi:hypothetical protein
MTPFGVITSEVRHSSDQAVAMVVDGRVEEGMRNYWAHFVQDSAADCPNEVAVPQAGDQLILVLEEMTVNLEAAANGGDEFDSEVDR